jgi:hypothetical protein
MAMGRRRDPAMLTQHLCRFCGARIRWGEILRLIRVDPDTPLFMLSESACHLACLAAALRDDVALAFPRRWPGTGPLPDDSADIDGRPCAICARAIAWHGQGARIRRAEPSAPRRLPGGGKHAAPSLSAPRIAMAARQPPASARRGRAISGSGRDRRHGL